MQKEFPIYSNIFPQFSYPDGCIYNADCITFLQNIADDSVDLIFADPPYNIKKANWDDFKDQDAYIEWSLRWIKEASRILKIDGVLYICGFTEIIADLKRPAMEYFEKCRWLIWYYDNKANLGNDWGRSHESILCFRKSSKFVFNIDDIRVPYNAHTLKYPERTQGKTSQYHSSVYQTAGWRPNPNGAKPKDVITLPTTCNGMAEKTNHPTQKPEALLRKIILSSSNQNSLVLDPFSGSGTTAVVCRQLQRYFLVNDISGTYNEWADQRLAAIRHTGKEYWIEYDKKCEARRRSIK